MKRYVLAAIALMSFPAAARAQETTLTQVEGLCDLSLSGQVIYEGTCVFERQADVGGASEIEVQMDNGLGVNFIRPTSDGQWTVATTTGTIPVTIDPQPGEVTYNWEGAVLTTRSTGDTATETTGGDAAATPSEGDAPTGGGLSLPGGLGNSGGGDVSIPGTGTSVPTSTGGVTNQLQNKAIEVLIRQLFGI